jgi:hypothetical protein
MQQITKRQSLNQLNTFYKKIKVSLKKRELDVPTVKLDIIFLILSKLEDQFLADSPYSILDMSQFYEVTMNKECPECGRLAKGNLEHFCFHNENAIVFERNVLVAN